MICFTISLNCLSCHTSSQFIVRKFLPNLLLHIVCYQKFTLCLWSTCSLSGPNHKFFSVKWIHLLFEAFGWKKVWIWLNPWFSMHFQSRVWSVADDVYTGTKHNGAPKRSLRLLEKMENKTNRSNIFWDWNVQVLFQNYFFFRYWSQS